MPLSTHLTRSLLNAKLVDTHRATLLASGSSDTLTLAEDEHAAMRRLSELQLMHALPAGCALDESYFEHVTVGGLSLFSVGLLGHGSTQSNVTGAAADREGFPVDRAFFEFIERLSLFSARSQTQPFLIRDPHGNVIGQRAVGRVFQRDRSPHISRAALSNGVALHTSWSGACAAAVAELIERDRVLRWFRGDIVPTRRDYVDRRLSRALREQYEIEVFGFDPELHRLTHSAVGVFLFPRIPGTPLVYGFAARRDADTAQRAATREALQRLAFLWGEPLPASAPNATPTPDYHQDFYLYSTHGPRLRQWLHEGRQTRSTKPRAENAYFDGENTVFIELTPSGLAAGLCVAKACSARAISLRFGRCGRQLPHPVV
jgi:hypothetical protein